MININWLSDDNNIDEIDPGKDIFALLFLSFFLINSVILICVSKQGENTVSLNTAGTAGNKIIKSKHLARIIAKNGKICIIQNSKEFFLPNDIEKLRKNAIFEMNNDKNGKRTNTLIIHDPGKSISAGEMLSAVQLLNNANIGVDFRSINKPDK